MLEENTRIIRNLQAETPCYHTRTMRYDYLYTCDLLLPKTKPAILRTIYKMLTGDQSAAEHLNETEIDMQVKLVLELGDPEITIDLRKHNTGRPGKFDVFWEI